MTRHRRSFERASWALGTILVVLVVSVACHRHTAPAGEAAVAPSSTEVTRPPAATPRTSAPPASEGSASSSGSNPPYRPHRLDALFRKLRGAESDETRRRVSILHVGDSHTASDTITGRLRELFQERFGSAGRGYAQPGEPWRTFRQEQMSYEMSDQWEAHLATEREIQPPLGAGGLRLVSDHEGAWLTRGTCREYCTGGTSMDGFAIHYLTQKEGGSFLVSVDGGRPTVVDTEGDTRDLGVFRRALDPGPHEIRIEVRGDGPVGIFGINTRDGVDGVEYASVGLNGATVSDWLATDDALVRKEVRRLSPDLFVFAFGTNEAYNLHHMRRDPNESFQSITRRMAEYQTRFTELIERYHSAAPGAACLVLLPPDMAPDGREDVSCEDRRVAGVRGEVCVPNTVRALSGIVALQRAAARRAGCSVWSQSHAMGGEGSIAIWHAYEPPLAQPDGVHLTMDGYDTLAEALFTDLMRVYDIWRSGGYVPLETQPIPPASKILAGP